MTKVTITITKKAGEEPLYIRVDGRGDGADQREVAVARALVEHIEKWTAQFPKENIIPKTESLTQYGSN